MCYNGVTDHCAKNFGKGWLGALVWNAVEKTGLCQRRASMHRSVYGMIRHGLRRSTISSRRPCSSAWQPCPGGSILPRSAPGRRAHAEAHHYLGLVARHGPAGKNAGLQWLRRAAGFESSAHAAHYNLGNLYAGLSRFAEAAKCYEQVVRLNPRHADAQNNLGIVLKEQGRLMDAVDCFRQALAVNPQHADALTNQGLHLAQQGQFAAAADCYEKALSVNPRHRLALGNRSLLRLLQGDFAAAWPDFEQRLARPGIVPRNLAKPRWDGSALQGKTILVYEEQGLGDTIQFARYLPMVRGRGGKVVFECPAR